MNCSVMDPAKRGNKLITYLPAESTRLHEAQMMGIGRFSPAHETGLLGDEPQMLFVTIATRLSDCEYAFVDDYGPIGYGQALLARVASRGFLGQIASETASPGSALGNSDNLTANASSTSLASAAVRLFLVMIPSCSPLVAFSVDCRAAISPKSRSRSAADWSGGICSGV